MDLIFEVSLNVFTKWSDAEALIEPWMLIASFR